MRRLILLLSFLLFYSFSYSQIFREDWDEGTLVNQYGKELQFLKKKYNLPTAFGFSKSITNRGGQLNETIVMWYVSDNGDTEDKIVSARILHYKEALNKPKDTVTQKEVVQNGQKIIVRDTVTIVQRDTILMEEVMNPDSLTFKAKRVLKNKNGYIITGNVNDKNKQIPVVLSTYRPDSIENGIDKRFEPCGLTLYMNNRAVGTMFNSRHTNGPKMIKTIKRNTEHWTGCQKDDCYAETFIVPAEWWNGSRVYWDWQRQLDYMRVNFPPTD